MYLGVHATLDIADTQEEIKTRLDSIDEKLATMKSDLSEQSPQLPSLEREESQVSPSPPNLDSSSQVLLPENPHPQELSTGFDSLREDQADASLLPLPADGFIDHSERVIQELGDMDARVEEFRTSMSDEERAIFEDMKQKAFHAAVEGTELVESMSEDELKTLKRRLLEDPGMAAYFLVVEDRILRQMVIDKAMNGFASPFSIGAEKTESESP